jgi:hypothetical protein
LLSGWRGDTGPRTCLGATAKWLSKNRDPRVIPALRRAAAGDVCPSVRAAAWQALEDLTAEDRPQTVPPRWLDAHSSLYAFLGDDWYWDNSAACFPYTRRRSFRRSRYGVLPS